MRRTIWFSLCCLVGIAVLASVRALAPLRPQFADSFSAEGSAPLAVKVDKLVGTADELPPGKITVKTVNVVPRSSTTEETGLGSSQKRRPPAYASMRGRTKPTHHKRQVARSRR